MRVFKMQLVRFMIFILLEVVQAVYSASTSSIHSDIEGANSPHILAAHYSESGTIGVSERKKVDYYEFRHVVAEGVQKALDECREKFKWDRWNCPKKAFLDILDRNPLPSNKEMGYTRALIASGIVLALSRSCSDGTNIACGCNSNAISPLATTLSVEYLTAAMISSSMKTTNNKTSTLDQAIHSSQSLPNKPGQMFHIDHDPSSKASKFIWRGCDEIVRFAFKISKTYLESQDLQQDEASMRINAHNYEVGRKAVKKGMVKRCKCHGISGSCQAQVCWTSIPDMSKVGEYLKQQYRLAAKVGAVSAEETNIASLKKELSSIKEKLVFANASPDYCYENAELGINGTLGRYCSKAEHRVDGSKVSRYERSSCDRLCTKCGYKIKEESVSYQKQCDCRFVYCCSVECKSCPHTENTYKCVRHS